VVLGSFERIAFFRGFRLSAYQWSVITHVAHLYVESGGAPVTPRDILRRKYNGRLPAHWRPFQAVRETAEELEGFLTVRETKDKDGGVRVHILPSQEVLEEFNDAPHWEEKTRQWEEAQRLQREQEESLKRAEEERAVARWRSIPRPPCPRCGTPDSALLVYGRFSIPRGYEGGLMAFEERANIILAGCVELPEDFTCKNCGYAWPGEGEFDRRSEV
jgi:hypothetical protein